MCVTPHIAAKAKGSAIDGRTTRHAGYAGEPEENASWSRSRSAGARRSGRSPRPCCAASTALRAQFTLTMAAYNLAKLPRLIAA